MTKKVYEAMIKKLTENNFTVHNAVKVTLEYAYKNGFPVSKYNTWHCCYLCGAYQVNKIKFNGEYIEITWREYVWTKKRYVNKTATIHRKYLINML